MPVGVLLCELACGTGSTPPPPAPAPAPPPPPPPPTPLFPATAWLVHALVAYFRRIAGAGERARHLRMKDPPAEGCCDDATAAAAAAATSRTWLFARDIVVAYSTVCRLCTYTQILYDALCYFVVPLMRDGVALPI